MLVQARQVVYLKVLDDLSLWWTVEASGSNTLLLGFSGVSWRDMSCSYTGSEPVLLKSLLRTQEQR